MKKTIYIISILLLVFNFNKSTAQDAVETNSAKKEILCQVIDQSTQLPVVFATVSIKDKNNGVITDENGNFRLPYRYKTQNDVLLISCIGYETRTIAVSTLDDDNLNVINLIPKLESLNTVTIVAKKNAPKHYIPVREIVGKAINRIPLNFPTTPHSYIGYYRDYQVLDEAYFNLSESILEVFDAGFQTNKLLYKDNQTALYDYKINSQFEQDASLTIAYDNEEYKFIEDATISSVGGNELNILNIHNAIRNYEKHSFSFVHVFKDNFLFNHEFRIVNKLYLDDTPIYEIKFFAKEDVVGIKNTAKGTIYISYETFAIHKLEYYGFKANDDEPFYSVTIEYVPKGSKMYLNYISFNNRFNVKSREDFKVEDVTFDKSENAFFVTFNNKVDVTTLSKTKNFRFIYKRKKLKINKVIPVEDTSVKISLVTGTLPNANDFNDASMKDLDYRIKNVTDVAGREIGKVSEVNIKQFRELFVQEVFNDKTLDKDLIFVNKSAHLNKSIINQNFKDKSKYWINTPLKATKN